MLYQCAGVDTLAGHLNVFVEKVKECCSILVSSKFNSQHILLTLREEFEYNEWANEKD